MNINIRGADADMVGALIPWGYCDAVLLRVTSVLCAVGPDCIGILYLAATGVIFGPDCIGIHSLMSISVCASMWITVC